MKNTTALNAKTIGMNTETIDGLKTWLDVTRVSQCSDALEKWLLVGDICQRVKAMGAELEGKFSDNVNEIIGSVLSNDERQYSMKLFDAEKSIRKFYVETGCMKYNPRTIWTAYQTYINPKVEKTPEQKEAEKQEKTEKELRKERKGIDAINALVEYRRIRNKAQEDGNLVLGDLETLRQELENELMVIVEAIEMEAPVKEKKTVQSAKAGRKAA